MVRAPGPPRCRAGAAGRASPPLRSFPSAARGRGRRGGRGRPASAPWRSPGDAVLPARAPEVPGAPGRPRRRPWPVLTRVVRAATDPLLRPEEALGRRRQGPPPTPGAQGTRAAVDAGRHLTNRAADGATWGVNGGALALSSPLSSQAQAATPKDFTLVTSMRAPRLRGRPSSNEPATGPRPTALLQVPCHTRLAAQGH
ncbi:unnamed protein product [Nyctereutes procyonoides]|uniref:(raccoon dog) hypothetical protein n=1 Tax=Nyctereutes procyonoides TaxID=34880 RepID=A0A811XZR0_NYCPR|nr:unnamed protein product [Nyctereutes procyonoides]